MLPLLTHPLALAALTALPALVAIYWLRNHYRSHPVSSLMLWRHEAEALAGGRRVRDLQTTLLFFLELLALLLLALAAAGPLLKQTDDALPLVVVLDDSFSMRAGGDEAPNSPRRLGEAALRDELRRSGRRNVRFVVAGVTPQLVGSDRNAPSAGVEDAILGWTCQAPAARLDDALALAAEVGGPHALFLVLTDQDGSHVPENGRVRWWAFGEKRPNAAIVNAVRTATDAGDRCFVEVANFWPDPRSVGLTLSRSTASGEEPVRQFALTLGANESRKVVLPLDDGTPAVTLRLGDDDLPFDNAAVLLPPPRPVVRVDVRVKDESLRRAVERAVATAPNVLVTGTRPHLIIGDDRDETAAPDVWRLTLLGKAAEPTAEAFAGPFVIDRGHPLADGLSLAGVIWAGGREPPGLAGAPVVMAGNIVLLADRPDGVGVHRLTLRLRPELSTLTETPGWPVLVVNLVRWRAANLPGLNRSTVRVGEEVRVTLGPRPEGGRAAAEPVTVTLDGPGAARRTIPVRARQAAVRPEERGRYVFTADAEAYPFAVNVFAPEESDLTSRVTGRWGEWLDETTVRLEYREIGWALVLAALGLLTLHLYLVARDGGRVR